MYTYYDVWQGYGFLSRGVVGSFFSLTGDFFEIAEFYASTRHKVSIKYPITLFGSPPITLRIVTATEKSCSITGRCPMLLA